MLQGAFLQLTLQDQGSGIPEDELDDIFDELTQRSKTTTDTGLGLSMCRYIVRAIEENPGRKHLEQPGLGSQIQCGDPYLTTDAGSLACGVGRLAISLGIDNPAKNLHNASPRTTRP